jgi:hypothetical protein
LLLEFGTTCATAMYAQPGKYRSEFARLQFRGRCDGLPLARHANEYRIGASLSCQAAICERGTADLSRVDRSGKQKRGGEAPSLLIQYARLRNSKFIPCCTRSGRCLPGCLDASDDGSPSTPSNPHSFPSRKSQALPTAEPHWRRAVNRGPSSTSRSPCPSAASLRRAQYRRA